MRVKNSLLALATLRDNRIISAADCADLTEAYRFLRFVEHRIQVVQERQTHNLPRKEDELLALARRCGYLRSSGLAKFNETLEAHRRRVSTIYGALFLSRDEQLREEVQPEIYFFLDHEADPDLIKDMLAERRFERVDAAYRASPPAAGRPTQCPPDRTEPTHAGEYRPAACCRKFFSFS